MGGEPVVFVVDSDPAARDWVVAAIAARGIAVESYASAEQFLSHFSAPGAGCLVVSASLDGISGLELQEYLRAQDVSLPVIVVTAGSDVRVAVQAMRSGAVTVLQKPCSEYELWTSVRKALNGSLARSHPGG